MMKELNFTKENNKWYIDLPEWEGSKEDLQMVLGADDMLDVLSEGEDSVSIVADEESFDGAMLLSLVRETPELDQGAEYVLREVNGEIINHSVWLCDVTKFVYGGFPEKLYLKRSKDYPKTDFYEKFGHFDFEKGKHKE